MMTNEEKYQQRYAQLYVSVDAHQHIELWDMLPEYSTATGEWHVYRDLRQSKTISKPFATALLARDFDIQQPRIYQLDCISKMGLFVQTN
jgi:hypothetical protein